MAIYSILLAIRTPIHYLTGNRAGSSAHFGLPSPIVDRDSSTLPPEKDAEMRSRIKWSLEDIFKSATGHQFIANISQLITVHIRNATDSSSSIPTSDMLFYRAYLVSVGHVSVNAPQNLIQNRLHEGYLHDVGSVDPDISRVDLVEAAVDPSSVTFSNDLDASSDLDTQPAETRHQWNSDVDVSLSKTIMVRSPDAFSPLARYPEHRSERESRQLSVDEDTHLIGGVMTPISDFASSSLHQPWPVRTSRDHIFRLPGVIAGIVGSVVVVLLLLILLILFCVYRLRKKDEGSYALDEPKKTPVMNAYQRAPTREFYA
ncbi:unnamed protein product [Dicrocoelium dendriticum]|nr:unnamed protein product [Dicrocoelium dendriticum]